MLLLSAFFGELLTSFDPKTEAMNVCCESDLQTTLHFHFTDKIQKTHVNVYYTDNYKPFDKSVF